MKIVIDTANLQFMADGSDIAIVYASNVSSDVTFSVSGPGSLVGNNPAEAIAGIATILLRSDTTAGLITVSAESGSSSGNATVATTPPVNIISFPSIHQTHSSKTTGSFIVRRLGMGISIEIPGAAAKELTAAKFTLYNALGQVAGTWAIQQKSTFMDIGSFAKGVYFGELNYASCYSVHTVLW
jgi:hypothetical protein